MKVLIVNGFYDNAHGKHRFVQFSTAVKDVTLTQAFSRQQLFPAENIDFQLVDRRSLDQYLSELNTGYLNTDSEKVRFKQLFDVLDFVFIDGDDSLLPWLEKTRKFLILLRMCKKTNKIVFASGFAMQIVVYLCATNLHMNRVVNGAGKGSSVEDFAKTDKATLAALQFGDIFLDCSTGDVYGYDPIKGQFYPASNTGLHNHKSAQENGIPHIERARRAMLKALKFQYRNNSVFASTSSEICFRIVKIYSAHWVNQGLGFGDYLALCGNAWDVHPINANSEENCYTVLAESDRGPMVITLNNTLCTQFHVSPKHPSSLVMLQNFVNHYMSVLHAARERLDIPIRQARFLPASHMLIKGTSRGNSQVEAGQHSVAYTVAKHSGFAFSKRGGPVLLGNNATTSMLIKASSSFDGSSDLSRTMSKSISISKTLRIKSGSQVIPKGALEESKLSPHSSQDPWAAPMIRSFLHPGYPVETMHKPPNASVHSTTQSEKKRIVRLVYKTQLPRSRTETWSTTAFSQRRFEGNTSGEMSPQRKVSWMSPKDFKRVFPHTTKLDLKMELDTTTVSARPKFREEEKGKWLAGPFFTSVSG